IYILLGGVLWRIFRKRIYLWYAHKSTASGLKLALVFLSRVFTPNKSSFRIDSPKVYITGHGIDTSLFSPESHLQKNGICQIVTIGRISRVKKNDIILQALACMAQKNAHLNMVGEPSTSDDYIYESDLT